MTTRIYMIAALLLIFAVPVSRAADEWAVEFGSASSVDDNVYKNYANYSDVFNLFFGSIYRDFRSDRANLRVHYNGSAAFYRNYSERNAFSHNLGGVWTVPYGNGERVLNMGGNAGFADYRDIFDIFDYWSLQGFVNVRQKLNGWSTLLGGFITQMTRYPDIPEFDDVEYEFFSRWQAFFPTRTTLNLGMSYARNHHFGNVYPANCNESLDAGGNPGSANGSKLKGEVLLAQSITDMTGINVSYAYSYPVNPSGQYIVTASGILLNESELFNDPFSYTMRNFGSQLTKMFSHDFTLTVGAGYLTKNFHCLPVYDLNGELTDTSLLRKDTRYYVSLSLGKTFYVTQNGSVDLYLNYLRIDNSSNDLYYRFKNNILNMSLSFGF